MYRSGKYDEVNVTVATTGLQISGKNNAYISNNVISGGGVGIIFNVLLGDGKIVGNTVFGGQGNGIEVSSKADLIIKENIIKNNTAYGISIQDAKAIIQNNTIRNNSGGGILLLADALVNYNNIQNNGNVSIFLSTASNINAQLNWWGTTDQLAINQSIYDFKNNFNVGTVSFLPFMSSTNSQAVPSTVPEFPAVVVVPLLFAVFAVAVIVKYRKTLSLKQ